MSAVEDIKRQLEVATTEYRRCVEKLEKFMEGKKGDRLEELKKNLREKEDVDENQRKKWIEEKQELEKQEKKLEIEKDEWKEELRKWAEKLRAAIDDTGNKFATVGLNIAIMKKAAKKSGSSGSLRPVLPRKKRRGGVLDDIVKAKMNSTGGSASCSWGSETGNMTKLESMDMEEECLKELGSGNADMTSKGLKRTKCDDNDDVLDELLLLLPPLSLKPVVQILVRKFFALDINLVAVVGKFSQEKLNFVRKIFSGVNGFGGASILLKFGGIIRATFTSNETMIAVANLANDYDIVVNTGLKCPGNNCMNRSIVLKKILVGTSLKTVHAAVSEFAIVNLEDQNQADLLASKWSILIGKDVVCVARADVDKQMWNARNEYRALFYTLPMGTTAHNLWDFIGSVSRKTCVIDHNSVSYSCAHCATVCFGSRFDLVDAIKSYLSLVLCLVCKYSGHTSLICVLVKDDSTLKKKKALFFMHDRARLANIYAKKSVPISHPLSFGGKTWTSVVGASSNVSFHQVSSFGSIEHSKLLPSVVNDLERQLIGIKNNFISLVEQIVELAKRLDSLMLTVSQSSSECQLLVTSLSQNQEEDIVMGANLGEATSDKTAAFKDFSVSSHVIKLENMLEDFFRSVLSLFAHFDSLALAGDAFFLPISQ
ncbi:hypothetical protein G9A89_012455 [Geosiphon pyriformis]|nr:hypothetical protein G9A89_012455 [Geosiphon pyriformis]